MKAKESLPESREELIEMMAKGFEPKFLPFWGHQVSPDGKITKSCFSQWYPAVFEINGVEYRTAEHYMMAEKARLFEDPERFEQILGAKSPYQAKKLGRMVKGYDDQLWKKHRFDIVVKGNIEKFNQNPELAQYLINTNQRILVEASPVDRIWGIGLAADDQRALKPAEWRGPNLLGFALIKVREQIKQ